MGWSDINLTTLSTYISTNNFSHIIKNPNTGNLYFRRVSNKPMQVLLRALVQEVPVGEKRKTVRSNLRFWTWGSPKVASKNNSPILHFSPSYSPCGLLYQTHGENVVSHGKALLTGGHTNFTGWGCSGANWGWGGRRCAFRFVVARYMPRESYLHPFPAYNYSFMDYATRYTFR